MPRACGKEECPCSCCVQCSPGLIGPQGPAGAMGPIGPQGPAGGVLNFADFYALMPPDKALQPIRSSSLCWTFRPPSAQSLTALLAQALTARWRLSKWTTTFHQMVSSPLAAIVGAYFWGLTDKEFKAEYNTLKDEFSPNSGGDWRKINWW